MGQVIPQTVGNGVRHSLKGMMGQMQRTTFASDEDEHWDFDLSLNQLTQNSLALPHQA